MQLFCLCSFVVNHREVCFGIECESNRGHYVMQGGEGKQAISACLAILLNQLNPFVGITVSNNISFGISLQNTF
jgi:hypothetical protein